MRTPVTHLHGLATPRKAKRKSEEGAHQAALFQWLSLWDASVRAVAFHIPNGGTRNPVEAKILKGQGVTAGVPDIFMAIPNPEYHGLFIEMKSKVGKVTEIQQQMHRQLLSYGYCVEVCYDWFSARNVILDYLGRSHSAQCPAA